MRVLNVCILVGVIGIAPASARADTIGMLGIDNGGLAGWSVLFDLTVLDPDGLLITDLDVNINSVTPVGTAFSLDIYTRSGTAVGFAENGGIGWTLATSGTGVSAAEGSPSPVNLLDFLVLAPGVTGIAIVYNNAGPAYFNGSLTFGNADLSLTGYEATVNQSGLFSGIVFAPRTWSGTITYQTDTVSVPEPASLTLLGLGLSLAGMAGRRWRQRKAS